MKFFVVVSMLVAGAMGAIAPVSTWQPLDAPLEAILTGTGFLLLASLLRRGVSYSRARSRASFAIRRGADAA